MVEQSNGRKPTFSSFETRKAFFREAVKNGVHKKDADLLSPDAWTIAKNISGAYYLTNASINEIADLYRMSYLDVVRIVRQGTLFLWYNSPPEIQDKYPVKWFRGSEAAMRKPKRVKSRETSINVETEFKIPIEQNPREPDIDTAVLDEEAEPVEETISQFSNDLDMWNIAKAQGLLEKMLKSNLVSPYNLERCKEYFEGENKKAPDADLEAFTVAFVKLYKDK